VRKRAILRASLLFIAFTDNDTVRASIKEIINFFIVFTFYVYKLSYMKDILFFLAANISMICQM